MRSIRGLVVLVLAGSVAYAAEPVPQIAGCRSEEIKVGRRLERSIEVDGVTRTFILDVPTSLRAGQTAPLLLDFHGFKHSAAGVWKVSKFRDIAESGGFITAYPQGLPITFKRKDQAFEGDGWDIVTGDGNRDVRFVAALLDQLEREYCIDRSRVYATGFSNGAYLSHLLACRMADRIAAIAPVSGGNRPTACSPSRPLSVLIHHGRQDEVVDVSAARLARDAWVNSNGCRAVEQGTCSRHDQCRADTVVEYCEGDFAHHWPAPATKRIWEFFQAHPMREGFEGSRGRGSEVSDRSSALEPSNP